MAKRDVRGFLLPPLNKNAGGRSLLFICIQSGGVRSGDAGLGGAHGLRAVRLWSDHSAPIWKAQVESGKFSASVHRKWHVCLNELVRGGGVGNESQSTTTSLNRNNWPVTAAWFQSQALSQHGLFNQADALNPINSPLPKNHSFPKKRRAADHWKWQIAGLMRA